MTKLELLKAALYDALLYRYQLDIEGPFGVEIEMGLMDPRDKSYLLDSKLLGTQYKSDFDPSISVGFPLEIVSPVLQSTTDTWKTLEDLSNRMKNCKLDFDTSAFQVNLDSNLSELELYHMALFFKTFEHIIFKFSQGFDLELRNMRFAQSLFQFFLYNDITETSHYALSKLIWNKKYAISLKNRSLYYKHFPVSIVEFRTPDSCDDCWLWQNYINTFYHFMKSIKSLDLDYIDYKSCFEPTKDYTVLHLKDALSFANIIFQDDIDKIYFLKHYIGRNRLEVIDHIKTLHL